jgi:hypothetical protein
MRELHRITFSLLAVMMFATNAHAASCYVNGGVGLTSPIGSGTHLGGVICGNLIEGAGCVLNLASNATGAASTDCLRVGRGVTVNGNGYSFNCPTGVHCGTAIEVSVSGTTGASSINDLFVNGRWTNGIYTGSSVASSATDVTINLADGMVRGGTGVSGIKTLTRAIVENADVGIRINYTGGAQDCIVHDCGVGVESTYDNTSLTNCLIIDNDTGIAQTVFHAARTNTSSSVIRNNACDCDNWNYAGCAMDKCINFTGETSTLDDTFQ